MDVVLIKYINIGFGFIFINESVNIIILGKIFAVGIQHIDIININ